MSLSPPPDLSTLLEAALGAHRAGDLARARGLYERILAHDAGHCDALNFLGILAHQSGDSPRAAKLIRTAIEHNPDIASYHNNLANVLEALGELENAVESYREALRLDPQDADPHFNLGTVLYKLGRLERAERHHLEATRIRPDDAEFHERLALVLEARGRLEDALRSYRAAIALSPNSAGIHNRLASVAQRLGRTKEAIAAYRRSLEIDPNDAKVHNNLGNSLLALGQRRAALGCYEAATKLAPDFAEAHRNLGRAYRAGGETERALGALRRALSLRSDYPEAWRDMASVLRGYRPSVHRPDLEPDLMACFAAEEVYHQDVAGLSAHHLKQKHRFRLRWQGADADHRALIAEITADALLRTLLTQAINTDPELEAMLTEARRRLLLEPFDDAVARAVEIGRLGALGLQCFGNEYVFAVEPDEERKIAALAGRLASRSSSEWGPEPALERELALLSTYEALTEQPFAGRLAVGGPDGWSGPVWRLIERTVLEPREEVAIAGGIESLGTIEDPTSRAVRAQYEESPYPRWLHLPPPTPVRLGNFLRTRYPHFSPPEFLDAGTRVLVPGCGTGQEALAIALARRDAQVLGVDLSRASLAYATRMAGKLGAGNVRFVHGDLLGLSQLDHAFEVIECTGVLHHMEDPIAGWRVLTEILRPGGVMKIGLYSAKARPVILAARAQIERLGLAATPRDVRAFRQAVLAAYPQGELSELVESEDFYTMSACRDLVFHAREHQFSLLQIEHALAELGLEFIGFDLPDPSVGETYRAQCPHDASMTDLRSWDEFEGRHPRTFSSLYRFWCRKPIGQ